MWDAKSMICSVMSICTDTGDPVTDPFEYGAILNKMPNCAMWCACLELNPDGIPHVHTLACTGQRSDAYKRSALTVWGQLKGTINLDITRDNILDVMKCQKCHRPSSMIPYMTKKPIWIMSNSERLLSTMDNCIAYQKGSRFIKENRTETDSMNAMTKEITQVILEHGCKTLEECMQRSPEIMQKYLHRGSFATVVNNCLLYVKATANIWNLAQYKSYNPDPSNIHGIIITQGIDVDAFDLSFYKWITKAEIKKNTFVLWGPSNTGKSALISGLKGCLPWGEIVNSNTFAFEALADATIGVWEEPLVSAELAEKAKQIFEGMECSIAVKYKKPLKLKRVPIIITTNHAIWRFCTAEEEMFKNRMTIWKFNHSMTEPIFVPRCGGTSCKCSYCIRCNGSETNLSDETVRGLQDEEQSIQSGILSGDGTETSNVGSGSMSTSSGSTERDAGSIGTGSTSTSSGSEEQCTECTGSSSSTSTTTERDIQRSSGEYGSSDTGIGISHSESGIEQHVGSSGDRGYDGENSRTNRKRRGSESGPRNKKNIKIDGDQNGAGENVGGMLGRGKTAKTQIEIQPKESGMDREIITTLKIPSVTDWKCYFSYLQTRYG